MELNQLMRTFCGGNKGYKYVLVDVHGREKGTFRDGKFDIPAEAGKDIKLTIDIDLQK